MPANPSTTEFAKRVVRLRDREGLSWKEVAQKLRVPYDQNGSSRLRRAYILGGGKTVGVRGTATAPAKKATGRKATGKATGTAKRSPRGTSAKRTSGRKATGTAKRRTRSAA